MFWTIFFRVVAPTALVAFVCIYCYLMVRKLKRDHKAELERSNDLWYELHEQSTNFWKAFVDQERVDHVLFGLAFNFAHQAAVENRVQRRKDLKSFLEVVKGRVAAAKKAFRESRAAAEERGFHVHASWSDYL